MRLSIAVLLAFLSCKLFGQVVSPEPILCANESTVTPNVPFFFPCELVLENFSFDAFNQEQFNAVSGISIYPDTDLRVSYGGIDLRMHPPTLDVAWFEPQGSVQSVPVYEKVEVGIDLPQVIDDAIDEFKLDPSSTLGLNPYNPNDIDAYAIIVGPSGVNPGLEKVNLFYYEEFSRNHPYTTNIASRVPSTHPNDHYGLWNWDEVQTDYRFRLRYAAKEQGIYSISINVVADGQTYTAAMFEIEATPAIDSRGFVRRSEHTRYLEFANDELFFPIGHQVGAHDKGLDWKHEWVKDYVLDSNCLGVDVDGNDTTDRVVQCLECVPRFDQPYGTTESGSKTYNQAYYLKSLEELEELKNDGANAGRVVFMPWNYELEYEELNNFEDRLHCAWEFDRMLDKANEIDIHLIVDLQSQYPFTYAPFEHYIHSDWPTNFAWKKHQNDTTYLYASNDGYCYQEDFQTIIEPLDFFKNDEALDVYKRKIRYYIARYGYSKKIAFFELLAEANGTVSRLGPLGAADWEEKEKSPIELHRLNIDGAGDALQIWHENIAQYIKEDLGHTSHLLAVHYLLNGPSEASTDDSYGIPWVDINAESRYTSSFMDPVDGEVSHVSGQVNHHLKPFFFAEYGVIDLHAQCSRKASIMRGMFLSGFTGTLGIGCNWDMWKNQDHSLWPYYKGVADFFEGVSLNKSQWLPIGTQVEEYVVTGNTGQNGDIPPKSLIGLYDHSAYCDDNFRMIGAVVNNTFNNFTELQYDCACLNPDGELLQDYALPEYYASPWGDFDSEEMTPIQWHQLYNGNPTNLDSNDPYEFIIPVPGSFDQFKIHFFNPWTAQYLTPEPVSVSSGWGGLVLVDHPLLIAEETPILFFELWQDNVFDGVRSADASGVMSSFTLDDVIQLDVPEVQVHTRRLSCTPNPCSGFSKVTWHGTENATVSIFDLSGKQIRVFSLTSGESQTIDLPKGTFLVKATSRFGTDIEKVICL